MRSDRGGITLIEVMAALALGALLLVGAHSLLGTLSDAGVRTTQRSVAMDDAGAGLARLRESVAMLMGPAEGGARFSGDTESARLSTRCRAAGGWLRPCTVELQLVRAGGSTAVQLSEDGGAFQHAFSLEGTARLQYLERRWEADLWVERWAAPGAAPAAIALLSISDTLLLLGSGR